MFVPEVEQGIIGAANGSLFIVKKMCRSDQQTAERHNKGFTPIGNIQMADDNYQKSSEQ